MSTKNKKHSIREPFADSKHPMIRKFNAIVYDVWKPKWQCGGWWYGRLYYFGDNHFAPCDKDFLNPAWFLDGMTPVGHECVLEMLEEKGRDVSKFRIFFDKLEQERARRAQRHLELRQSASEKLTPEERKACGLPELTPAP